MRAAARTRDHASDFAQIAELERKHVLARRKGHEEELGAPLQGLALSGGGLRAAAVGLGVARGLQEQGEFERFDYLSSVSGGSYCAAALVWFARPQSRLEPAGSERGPLPPAALRYVRDHASYLAPGAAPRGRSATASVPREPALGWAVFRGTALSLFVHGALLVGLLFVISRLDALVALLRPVLRLASSRPPWTSLVEYLDSGLVAAGAILLWALASSILRPLLGSLWSAWEISAPRVPPQLRDRALKGAFCGLCCGLAVVLAVGSLFSDEAWAWKLVLTAGFARAALSFYRRWRGLWGADPGVAPEAEAEDRAPFGWLAVWAGLLPATLLAVTILGYVFVSGRQVPAEPLRLNTAFGMALAAFTVAALALLLPRALRWLWGYGAALWSETPLVDSAPESPRAARWRRDWYRQRSFARTLGWGGFLLVLGTVPVVSEQLVGWIPHPGWRLLALGALLAAGLWLVVRRAPPPLGSSSPSRARVTWRGALGGVALLYGTLIFAHAVVVAILNSSVVLLVLVLPLLGLMIGGLSNVNQASPGGAYRERLAEAFLPDDEAVEARVWQPAVSAMSYRLSQAREVARGPFPLFNASLRIAESWDARRQARGGDSFFLSPLFCGSEATGYVRTDVWAGDGLRLVDAMGISAAAVAPGGGAGLDGSWGSRLFARALSLLNLRLSYWIENPYLGRARRGKVPARPNFLRPLLSHAWGACPSERRRFVELSDGGHFDDLGLYELVRRRLPFIVVVDATHDPAYRFAALGRALEHLRADFGVQIQLPLAELGLGGAGRGERSLRRPWALGRIDYPGGDPGTLVYLKAGLLDDLPAHLAAFAAQHSGFPQEDTPDAEFTPSQFAAYEELGHRLARLACTRGGPLHEDGEAAAALRASATWVRGTVGAAERPSVREGS